jgi:hypothetical protein
MGTVANNNAAIIDPLDGTNLVALTLKRLKELDRLRDVGFVQVGRLNAATKALSPELEFKLCVGGIKEFDRVARAIRQITVLEFELRGLFKAPDRARKLRLVKSDRPDFEPSDYDNLFGDLGDYDEREYDEFRLRSDYRTGPMEEVVAGIREVLGAEPPPNDPFALPADRKPTAKAPEPVKPAPAPPKGPEYYMRTKPAEPTPVLAQTAPSQNVLAVKAADLVMKTLAGKGFRQPSKAEIKKHRKERGPPK